MNSFTYEFFSFEVFFFFQCEKEKGIGPIYREKARKKISKKYIQVDKKGTIVCQQMCIKSIYFFLLRRVVFCQLGDLMIG